MAATEVLHVADATALGSEDSILKFGEGDKPGPAWHGRRYLMLANRPAFELSFWCGTCPFLFERMEGANQTLSIEALEGVLSEGLDEVADTVVKQFGKLLPRGNYLPLLLEMTPRLVTPRGPGDYFSEEQVRHQGIDSFWGLPEYTRTPYYRSADLQVDAKEQFFEFVVPMVPPTWNDRARLAEQRRRLESSSAPTAVAVSILEITQPAVSEAPDGHLTHWCLAHFLLDGHHKMQAAAESTRRLRLLTLLALDFGLAKEPDLRRVPEILRGGLSLS